MVVTLCAHGSRVKHPTGKAPAGHLTCCNDHLIEMPDVAGDAGVAKRDGTEMSNLTTTETPGNERSEAAGKLDWKEIPAWC